MWGAEKSSIYIKERKPENLLLFSILGRSSHKQAIRVLMLPHTARSRYLRKHKHLKLPLRALR